MEFTREVLSAEELQSILNMDSVQEHDRMERIASRRMAESKRSKGK